MIQAKNIHKYFGMWKISVLRDISFSVPAGRTAALLGVSGSGKSTMMGILSGGIAPSMGEILFDGCEYGKMSDSSRRQIGYMPVKMKLYPEMTVNEYMDHILGMKKIRKAERKEYTMRALEQTHLQDSANKLIQNATIYERMRLKLAQAIAGETKYLLMDDPTTLLKASESAEMREIIGSILETGKYTTVISTQQLREAKELADDILIINNGKIAINTSAEELAKGQKMLKMRLGAGQEKVKEYIREMCKVAEVDVLCEGDKSSVEIMLKYPRETDLREFAWKKTTEYGLPILEMAQQDISLEEIYLQITGESH